jgi:hypothetical protein
VVENGACGIDTVTIAVGELSEVERWYSTVLGQSGKPTVRSELGAEGLFFSVGPHRVEFLKPLDSSSPLINWIRTFGPSPYSATLRSKNSDQIVLDNRLLHGANIELTGAK